MAKQEKVQYFKAEDDLNKWVIPLYAPTNTIQIFKHFSTVLIGGSV